MKNLIVICFFLFLPILNFSQCSPSGYIPQHDNFFGIYTATLEGKEMKILINSSWQEMSHPRVSPDGEWVTFTRYNMKDSDGIAQEANGYLLTEIMIMKSDGTDVKTLVPKMNDTMNANSSWTPDGNHLLYVTTDTPNGTPAIAKIHIYSKERTFIKTPKDAIVSDPNQCGEWICFPLREANHSQQNIWVMKEDGSEVYQLTKETIIQRHENMEFLLGDYDPHFSPDAQEIAFMRYYGGTEWHLVVIIWKPDKIRTLPKIESQIFHFVPIQQQRGPQMEKRFCFDISNCQALKRSVFTLHLRMERIGFNYHYQTGISLERSQASIPVHLVQTKIRLFSMPEKMIVFRGITLRLLCLFTSLRYQSE